MHHHGLLYASSSNSSHCRLDAAARLPSLVPVAKKSAIHGPTRLRPSLTWWCLRRRRKHGRRRCGPKRGPKLGPKPGPKPGRNQPASQPAGRPASQPPPRRTEISLSRTERHPKSPVTCSYKTQRVFARKCKHLNSYIKTNLAPDSKRYKTNSPNRVRGSNVSSRDSFPVGTCE